MSILTDIFVDLNEEIDEYLTDKDVIEHINWILKLDTPSDVEFIKHLKLLIFDYETLDTLCYDLEITYYQLLTVILRNYPTMLTPHFTRQIKLRFEEFMDVGTDKSNVVVS